MNYSDRRSSRLAEPVFLIVSIEFEIRAAGCGKLVFTEQRVCYQWPDGQLAELRKKRCRIQKTAIPQIRQQFFEITPVLFRNQLLQATMDVQTEALCVS